MLLGRFFGWLLIGVTVIMASADAVMALSPTEYASILTADVVTLLIGAAPEPAAAPSLGMAVMDLPAWVVIGVAGLALLVISRKRHRRQRLFRH